MIRRGKLNFSQHSFLCTFAPNMIFTVWFSCFRLPLKPICAVKLNELFAALQASIHMANLASICYALVV